MGSVIKKRRKRMAKKKHRKLLRKTRHQRSYKARLSGSRKTSYASVMLLNFSSESFDPLLRSGWYVIASLRYANFISASLAPRATPSVW